MNIKTYNTFQQDDVNVIPQALNPSPATLKMSTRSESVISFTNNNSLLAHSKERYVLAGENAPGRLDGVASQSNSMDRHSDFVVDPNSPKFDRTEQTLVAQDFTEACLGLIRVRESLAKLSRPSKSDFDEVLDLSLSFANAPNDSDRSELIRNHFKLIVGGVITGNLAKDVNWEPLKPNNEIATEPSTSHQKDGQQVVESNDGETKDKIKVSKLARFLGLFKRKEKSKQKSTRKGGRWKRLFCCSSIE